MRKPKWFVLAAGMLLASFTIAQQDDGSTADDDNGSAASDQRDKDDKRSDTRRRVERETAAWVEQILEEKREREAHR